jgi:hypothetical protein
MDLFEAIRLLRDASISGGSDESKFHIEGISEKTFDLFKDAPL